MMTMMLMVMIVIIITTLGIKLDFVNIIMEHRFLQEPYRREGMRELTSSICVDYNFALIYNRNAHYNMHRESTVAKKHY